MGGTRETRDGWPLLTVEAEMNGDLKSTNERGPSLVGSLGLCCRYKRFLSCLGCSIRPRTKYFFLTIHYFNSFVPIAQQAGQSVSHSYTICTVGLLLNMYHNMVLYLASPDLKKNNTICYLSFFLFLSK